MMLSNKEIKRIQEATSPRNFKLSKCATLHALEKGENEALKFM